MGVFVGLDFLLSVLPDQKPFLLCAAIYNKNLALLIVSVYLPSQPFKGTRQSHKAASSSYY